MCFHFVHISKSLIGNGIYFLIGSNCFIFSKSKKLLKTHLFHDARFSLGERRVAPQLILDIFHLNFYTSFGFLAIREWLAITIVGTCFLLRCGGCCGRSRRCCWYARRWVCIVWEAIVCTGLRLMNCLLLDHLLIVLFITLTVILIVIWMMTLQIVFIVCR